MKRLDGRTVARGLAVAAGLYLLWGLFNGSFDGQNPPSLEDGGGEPPPTGYMSGLEETPVVPMPQPTPIPEAPPVQSPAAPASEPPPAPPTPGPAPTAQMPAGSGIIEWFKQLSPPAQSALAQGFAGGTAGLMAALAQRNAQQDAENARDEMREDRRRRGAIPAIGSGFIARAKGG